MLTVIAIFCFLVAILAAIVAFCYVIDLEWQAIPAVFVMVIATLSAVHFVGLADEADRERGDREAERCEQLGGTPIWDEFLEYDGCKELS